jgi:hypothetical protein
MGRIYPLQYLSRTISGGSFFKTPGRIHGLATKNHPRRDPARGGAARREFENVGGVIGRCHPDPGTHARADFQDAPLSVKEDRIDGESHKAHVNGIDAAQQQALSGLKSASKHQPLQPRAKRRGQLDVIADKRAGRYDRYAHADAPRGTDRALNHEWTRMDTNAVRLSIVPIGVFMFEVEERRDPQFCDFQEIEKLPSSTTIRVPSCPSVVRSS